MTNPKLRAARLAWKCARAIFIGFLLIFSLTPILWLVQNAFKSRADIFSYPLVFFFTPTFEAWREVLRDNMLGRTMTNSAVIATAATLVTLIVSSSAAYAFSRFIFWGRNALLLVIMATRLLPPISSVVVLYLIYARFNLIDTHVGLVAIYAALHVPLATWLMKSFFDTVPIELEHAAMIEGCTRSGAVRHVLLPLAAPGIATVALLFWVRSWNEFMFAFIFSNIRARTMPLTIAETVGEFQIYWDRLAVMSTILILPAVAIALLAQRHVVRGLTAGAIK